MEGVFATSQRQRQRPDRPSSPPSLLPSALPANIAPSHAPPPRARSSSPTPPPQLSPFFTLITSTSTPTSADTTTTSHHHPHIHYIFSDDDDNNDAITTAALDLLEPNPAHAPPNDHATRAQNPPPPRERYLLLDLDPTGTLITRAQSMSPDFQILSTSIVPAPTWETSDEGAGAHPAGSVGGGGLMLKIVGTEGTAYRAGAGAGRLKAAEGTTGLEAVVGEYEARMGELRRVIEGASRGLE